MKNNLTCEIVEDLMPSYIDGLTSEVTNKAVREHLSQCGKCNAKLDTMSEPYSEDKIEQEKKEIDFLKKNRRKYNCYRRYEELYFGKRLDSCTCYT